MCDIKCQTWQRKCDVLGLFCWIQGEWLVQIETSTEPTATTRFCINMQNLGMYQVGQGFIQQQDNDSKHTSKVWQTYLRKKTEQDGKLEEKKKKKKNRVAGLFYFKLTGQKNKRKATRKCHTFVGTSKTGLGRIFDFHCRGNCHKLLYLPEVDALMNQRFRKHFDL